MKERMATLLGGFKQRWGKVTKKQKWWLFIGATIAIISIVAIVLLSSYKHYVPLYSDLSPEETGQIKDTLDSKGVPYKIGSDGTTISVPDDQVNNLKVELAAEGLPKTGQIDYSFFGQNANFGMTDKQFDVLERAAVQNELSNLISGISGVDSAKVMINLPQQSVWVSDNPDKASASIVLKLKPGYSLKQEQVEGLYHLVAKSVPNLPEDNIVIMDQYFNYYDKNSSNNADSTLSVYQQQQQVKEDIEKNIRNRVQQMLGMMMGNDKVMVNVTSDIDFTKEKSSEDLVEPVDKDTMQGLQVSTEHIAETYKGQGAGGVVGTGNNQVPNYPSSDGGNGDYQHVEDRVNNVFNKIHNDIVQSPYKIKDLGIQVMVEPPNPNDTGSLPQQNVQDIKQILSTIVQTTLSQNGQNNMTQQELDDRTVVTIAKFNGKTADKPVQKPGIPLWMKIGGVAAGVIILILVFLLWRSRKKRYEEDIALDGVTPMMPKETKDLIAAAQEINPEDEKKKQLEEMARKHPEEFAKLLRTWLSDS
ncbi:MAG: flagellar basal-body MS-ring/collar protein FliF [Tuberibacillus sp.]